MIITQVDKDKSGIAFICKKVAYTLTKRFIYGPNPKKEGLFSRDPRTMEDVIADLRAYLMSRKMYTKSENLPQFKLIMKLHKKS